MHCGVFLHHGARAQITLTEDKENDTPLAGFLKHS
jgi:hypothetical protein